MRSIRRLADLERDGTDREQRFAILYVASRLDVHPDVATDAQRVAAWREAQNKWERTVSRIADALDDHDLDEAEHRARRILTRVALARLQRLGWS
jgi:hypothetical protein